MIIAQVSSDTFAQAEGILVHTGSPILALCRELLSAGHGSTIAMEVYRGDVLALRVRSIGEAAVLRVNSIGCTWPLDRTNGLLVVHAGGITQSADDVISVVLVSISEMVRSLP
jgi:hypothetical protein